MLKKNEFWMRWLPAFVFAILVIIAFKLITNIGVLATAIGGFFSIVAPFLYAILIVYFLYKPSVWLEDLYTKTEVKFFVEKARVLSVLTVYLILIIAITLFFNFLVPILVNSVVDFVNNIPLLLANIPTVWFGYHFDIKDTAINWFNSNYHLLLGSNGIETVTRSAAAVFTTMFNIALSLIVSLYILIERDRISSFVSKLSTSLFSKKTHKRLVAYLRQVNKVNFTFISSKGIDALINFFVVTGILLIFNVPYALLFGLIAGIGNFIPFLGTLIAVTLISLVTLLTSGFALALKVLIILIIFQQIDANFIEPKLMSANLQISPLLVIFSVIVGGAYFGVIGMFLGVPVATIIKQLLLEYMKTREVKEA